MLKRRHRAASQLTFQPLAELLANVPVEPEWLWRELLAPGSLTLLAGQPKVGKSTLVYGLLGALATGQSFLGRATRTTRALILSEEPNEAINAKVSRFGGDVHHGIRRSDLRALRWPDQIAAAAAHARTNDLGLLVIDTFADLAGLRGDEENDAGAVLGAIDPIKRAAEEEGLAALLVHHQRKSGGQHGAGIRGSGAFAAAVDVIAELERSSGKSKSARALKYESRYSPQTRVALELTDAGYIVSGGQIEQDNTRIFAAIDAVGRASKDELNTLTGIAVSTLGRRLPTLEQAGQLVSVGDGRKGSPVLWERAA